LIGSTYLWQDGNESQEDWQGFGIYMESIAQEQNAKCIGMDLAVD
jgi:hypothetical protein